MCHVINYCQQEPKESPTTSPGSWNSDEFIHQTEGNKHQPTPPTVVIFNIVSEEKIAIKQIKSIVGFIRHLISFSSTQKDTDTTQQQNIYVPVTTRYQT